MNGTKEAGTGTRFPVSVAARAATCWKFGPSPRFFVLALTLLAVAQVHCRKPEQAGVEAIEGTQARPLPFKFASLEGRRDGARVNATVEYEDRISGGRMVVELDVDLGPPIRLANGRFQINDGGRMMIGTVTALSLDFEAGQSGGMSIGGRFNLQDSTGKTRYRVALPPSLIGPTFR